jgi:hypothetical protein
MQYGLDLSRRLLQEIQNEVTARGGDFVIFRTRSNSDSKEEIYRHEQIYVLRGKYYKVSLAQEEASVVYMNQGFKEYVVPITLEDHYVGPADYHLNEHATDQVMKDLANSLADLIPDRGFGKSRNFKQEASAIK